MKLISLRCCSVFLFLGSLLAAKLSAADAEGIKAANLRGADLELMSNHDPASQLENFEMLEGYEANLFAADPMLANPIHMQWDSRGRLWVACSWTYPQIVPGSVANDKIIILEDTDNDGAADKSTVFAEGLYLPTGLELANGGCYVAQSPDLFFLKDTDGDDVADVKELVLTGFGIEDSHHSISALRRGPGGWIYFQEGIFLHTQVETQYGVVRNFNGGVYQFNPRTTELRIFCRGTGGNPWGHVMDRWGQSFIANNPRIMYISPATGNSGENVKLRSLITTDKQCGGDLASGTHIGDDLRGQFLTGRFKGRSVVRYEFTEDGAGFSANVLKPLIFSKHPNFRPVDVKVGPDGAIYVADWYNSIINHAQHDFRDPRRDHDHGRIWRITHKERPLAEKPQLEGISVAALVDHLKSPETWTRHQAREELSRRDPDTVLAAVEAWTDGLSPDVPDYAHHLVEAMWACQNVERVSESILRRVLASEEGHARSAGARVMRYWHDQLADPAGMIAELSTDPFPRTRMEAVLSAGFIPQAEAFVAALGSLDHEGDAFLDLALPQTMKALRPYWRPALEAGVLEFEKPSHRAYAEQEAGIGLEERLVDFLNEKTPSQKDIGSMRTQLLKVGGERELGRLVYSLATDSGQRSEEATAALFGMLEKKASPAWSKSLKRKVASLTGSLDDERDLVAMAAAGSLGAWGVGGEELIAVLADGSRSDAVRREAALALGGLEGTRFVEALGRSAATGDAASRYAALVGLLRTDFTMGLEEAVRLFSEDPAGSDPVPAIQAILKTRRGGAALTNALEGVRLHPAVSNTVSAFHRSSGLLPSELAALFQARESSGSLSADLLSEDQAALAADVETYGNAARGEAVFRRNAVACASCHAIGSAGPTIGPNLVVVGAAASAGYMVESILKPNAAIAEHYENKLITLRDGTVQVGVVTFESDKELVVRDAALVGKEVSFPKADVLRQQSMPSLMPAGLADQLESRAEFLDLAKFLSVLGRPGPYANDESPVIRKWSVVAASGSDALPLEGVAWKTVYSKVSGVLPLEDISSEGRLLAKGYVEVQAAGRVMLAINETAGLSLWVDGEAVRDLRAPIDLERGRREFVFGIDAEQRGETGLRVELKAADREVRVKPEGGM